MTSRPGHSRSVGVVALLLVAAPVLNSQASVSPIHAFDDMVHVLAGRQKFLGIRGFDGTSVEASRISSTRSSPGL